MAPVTAVVVWQRTHSDGRLTADVSIPDAGAGALPDAVSDAGAGAASVAGAGADPSMNISPPSSRSKMLYTGVKVGASVPVATSAALTADTVVGAAAGEDEDEEGAAVGAGVVSAPFLPLEDGAGVVVSAHAPPPPLPLLLAPPPPPPALPADNTTIAAAAAAAATVASASTTRQQIQCSAPQRFRFCFYIARSPSSSCSLAFCASQSLICSLVAASCTHLGERRSASTTAG